MHMSVSEVLYISRELLALPVALMLDKDLLSLTSPPILSRIVIGIPRVIVRQ